MSSLSHLAVLVLLLVITATSAQPQQRPQQQQQQQQNLRSTDNAVTLKQRRQQGDIDAIPPNARLLELSKEDVTSVMNNPKSVAILTRCFVEPTNCKSASAYNIINRMNTQSKSGGQCKDCTPAEGKYLDELMTIFVQGYTSLYPDQWQLVFPQVKVLVAAVAQRGQQ